jgi:hypothetical protein
MAEDYLSILPFARQTFTRSVNNYKQAIDGLTEEQVFYQPTSECNSIGWLGWHLSRRKDYYSSKLTDDTQTWVKGGWYEKFGMNDVETGTGHTLEEVAAFHPDLHLLFSYIEAVNADGLARLDRVDPATMEDEVDLDAGRGMKPRHNCWNPMLSDCLQHTGQIAYLRGLITGKGWFTV